MAIRYNENYDGTRAASDVCIPIECTPMVVEPVTLPGTSVNRYIVYFKFSADQQIFVGINATPSAPVSGAVTVQPYVEFRPEKLYAKGGDVLNFLAATGVPATEWMGISLAEIS